MCRTKEEGGRRCSSHYVQRISREQLNTWSNVAHTINDLPAAEAGNAHRQVVKRGVVAVRKLQAETYNLNRSLNKAVGRLSGEGETSRTFSVIGEDGREYTVKASQPAERFDASVAKGHMTVAQINECAKKSLSLQQLKEHYPEVYENLTEYDGRKIETADLKVFTQDPTPVGLGDREYSERNMRYVNQYADQVEKAESIQDVAKLAVELTTKLKETTQVQTELSDALAHALPEGARVEAYGIHGVRVKAARKAPTQTKVRQWGKEHPEKWEAVRESMEYLAVDSAKVKKKYPETYEKSKVRGKVNHTSQLKVEPTQ